MGQLTGWLEQDKWQKDCYRTAWLTGWLNNARHPVVHPIIYPIHHPISHPFIRPLRRHAVISPTVHPVSCPVIGLSCSSSHYLLVLFLVLLLTCPIPCPTTYSSCHSPHYWVFPFCPSCYLDVLSKWRDNYWLVHLNNSTGNALDSQMTRQLMGQRMGWQQTCPVIKCFTFLVAIL